MADVRDIVALCPGLRAELETRAARGETVRYRDLARAAGVPGPQAIHKTTAALEALAKADHAAGRPLLAALAVGRASGGLPGPGFFQLLRELGRYQGPDDGPEAAAQHARELDAVFAAYRGPAGTTTREDKIMAGELRITVGAVTITATLRETPTAQAVAAVCPIEATANTWGEEVYFAAALDARAEADQRAVVEPGEIAYWIEGGAIAIGYGPTPASQGDEIRLAAPVNIFADADPETVRQLKGSRGGEPVTVELA